MQTKIVQRLTTQLDSLTGFTFELDYINLNWFDEVKLEGLKVTDTKDSVMIYVPAGTINFNISTILDERQRTLDKVSITNAEVSLTKYEPDEPINITLMIDTLKARLSGDKRVPFLIGDIEIENSTLNFKNHTNNTPYPGFDINDFSIDNLTGTARNFTIETDTINFSTSGLSGVERKTKLPIRQLKTDFTVHQQEMKLGNLELLVGESIIKDSIAFTYNRMSNLSYFLDSVNLYIRLDNSLIHSEDLAWFSKEFRSIHDTYKLSGVFRGGVKDFSVRNTDLEFGNGGRIRGLLSMEGLPNLEETFMSIRLANSNASYRDLLPYLGKDILDQMNGITEYAFSGNFTGFISDFVAYGNFRTNLGTFITDLNIKTGSTSTYVGKLTTRNFDLGTYSGLDVFQRIDLVGEIRGQGFEVSNADFILDGKISRLGINNYDVTNIETNARFASEIFQGELSIDDPNVRLNAKGSIDIRDRIDLIEMDVLIDTIQFDKLNLTEVPASMSGYLDVDVTGLAIDSLEGTVFMGDMLVNYDTNFLDVDRVRIESKKLENSRSFQVSSDYLDLFVSGSFQYTWLFDDFSRLYKEYQLNLENKSENITQYYNSPRPDNKREYGVEMRVDMKDVNPILNLVAPNNFIGKNVSIDASFSNGFTAIFQAHASIDTLQFPDYEFYNNIIEIGASKIADSSNVLASVYLASENQRLKNSETIDLITEAIWDRNTIDFNFMIEQPSISSYADLYGNIVFLQDLTVLKLNESDLQLLDEKWQVLKDNTLTIAGSEIGFQAFGFGKNDEKIIANGALSREPDQPLKLELIEFQLSNFNPLLQRPLQGTSNGYLQLKDFYGAMFFETEISVDSLHVNDFLIGDLDNKSVWQNEEKRFDLVFEIEREGKKLVDIQGDYYPNVADGLHLNAQLQNANVNAIEPFVSDFFSGFGGTIDGAFTITGNPQQPEFRGNGIVKDGTMHINYLNTTYAFTSDIAMEDNRISLNNTIINDKNGSTATMEGGFRIDDVNNIFLDFAGSFTDFLVLNTTLGDNDAFYGTAIGTGRFRISGYPTNISIDVDASTSAGARMFIPLGGSSDVNTEEFIHFISFQEQKEQEEPEKRTVEALQGLDFNLNLNVTRDAYIELIFDLTAGDIMRGRGTGQLNFHFNPLGEFTMVGDYTIEEGGYNFTLYNIVNKEFEILPNSTISWLGDPYAGNLNIQASYDLMASVAPLLDTAYRNAPEIRRRYLSKVLLDLKGPLLSPTINFDIEIEDYPNNFSYQGAIVNLGTEISAVEAVWNTNEQELQKQVFSLMIMRKFAERNINTGGSIGRSVSEFLSNQLSYWISQVDENLEISLDLGELSAESVNTFQMRLSYTFLEGRLRVTRDGGFTDPQNEANVASILGDWSVEYFLTENGNLRIKLFQETNYNTLNQATSYDYTALQGGISLLYTQSFDEISEIFRAARKKKSQQEQEEPTSQVTEKHGKT